MQSVLLCPGHSNEDVGELAAALGEGVSVSVARGDPRGGRVAAQAMEAAGWFVGETNRGPDSGVGSRAASIPDGRGS